MRLFITAGVLALLTLACGGNAGSSSSTDSTVTPPKPAAMGSFGFSAISQVASQQDAAKSEGMVQVGSLLRQIPAADVASTPGTTASSFNFGNLPSSATYLFELKNTGTLPVNNVTITSDAPEIVVLTPSQIAVLPTEGTGSVVPLLQAQVLHGIGLNGYGSSPTLPAGDHTYKLTATGTDTNNNTIVATATIHVFAQVAEVEMWEGTTDSAGTVYPAEKLEFGTSGWSSSDTKNYGAQDNFTHIPQTGWWFALKQWHVSAAPASTPARVFTVKNKGNVPLTITNYGGTLVNGVEITPQTYTVPAGESVDITITAKLGIGHAAYMSADSNNTVFRSGLLSPDTDGKMYLYTMITEQ